VITIPKRLILAVLIAVTCLHGQAASRHFIWKASAKSGGTVYLVGSVHLLTPDYYPLGPVFDDAFAQSDLLVEELDMGDMLSPNAQLDMLRRGMMPLGQTLDRVISPTTFAAVVKTLDRLGMPVQPMKQFKPWMLALTLQGIAWQKAGFNPDFGLDKHFYDRAIAESKAVQGLETVAFQIAQFDEMPMDLQDRLLAQAMEELEDTTGNFTRLADAWKAGDAEALESIVLDELRAEPQMYQRLLVSRNEAWLPRIEAFFSRPRPAFVVVGAAHLIGADGLLERLRARGYTLEQL
jgi:uncharacterized protein YbaP (TraB family)